MPQRCGREGDVQLLLAQRGHSSRLWAPYLHLSTRGWGHLGPPRPPRPPTPGSEPLLLLAGADWAGMELFYPSQGSNTLKLCQKQNPAPEGCPWKGSQRGFGGSGISLVELVVVAAPSPAGQGWSMGSEGFFSAVGPCPASCACFAFPARLRALCSCVLPSQSFPKCCCWDWPWRGAGSWCWARGSKEPVPGVGSTWPGMGRLGADPRAGGAPQPHQDPPKVPRGVTDPAVLPTTPAPSSERSSSAQLGIEHPRTSS